LAGSFAESNEVSERTVEFRFDPFNLFSALCLRLTLRRIKRNKRSPPKEPATIPIMTEVDGELPEDGEVGKAVEEGKVVIEVVKDFGGSNS
jgi:hypothetical protein